jgi:hypothetical protein
MIEVVYASAAKRLFDPVQLGTLLETARRNNARLSVSGILLYDAGSFIQVLEGEEQVVQPLLDTISRDERHHRVQVLRRGEIQKRSFAAWSMGFVTLDPQLFRAFPRRHGLSANGSLIDDASEVLALLDAFRAGQLRTYILG